MDGVGLHYRRVDRSRSALPLSEPVSYVQEKCLMKELPDCVCRLIWIVIVIFCIGGASGLTGVLAAGLRYTFASLRDKQFE